MPGARPKETMTLPDSRRFIRNLVRRWFNTLP
jgi:hypothetical protein